MKRVALNLLVAAIVAAVTLTACATTQAGHEEQVAATSATQTAIAPTSTPIPIDDLRPLFDYDSAAPLEFEETGVDYQGEIAIHDISYASPMGGRVTAYLVVPPGEGPFAAILLHHPGDGSRDSLLDEAVALASTGAVCLLIDAPWARPEPWHRETNYDPENDRALYIQNVVDMERGIDLLDSREEVDPERIGFFGHSYGAHMGGVLAGVETRVKAYVFMAGVPSLSDRIPHHISSVLPADHLAAYLEATAPLDAVNYVRHAAPAELLFQCGRQDEILDEATSLRFYAAGSEPKEIVWYDAGHGLNDEAFLDRARWLGERLGLDLSTLE
jgi:cephalosporin-C deacetylase-like acetyl esterase